MTRSVHPVLTRVLRHLRATGVAPTKFGRDAVNDPRLVRDLKNGRAPGNAVLARIDALIEGKGTGA